jgi:hypothetical protein
MPGSPTTPGWAGTRDDAPVHVAFRASDHVGTRDFLAFAAQWLAYALPYRRFADTLANANARLGADADRYSFTVVDSHLLLFAGFDRRTIIQEFCTPGNALNVSRRRRRPRSRREHDRGFCCGTCEAARSHAQAQSAASGSTGQYDAIYECASEMLSCQF